MSFEHENSREVAYSEDIIKLLLNQHTLIKSTVFDMAKDYCDGMEMPVELFCENGMICVKIKHHHGGEWVKEFALEEVVKRVEEEM